VSRSRLRRWGALGLGLGLMAGSVVAMHHGTSSAGEVMARSRAQGLESDAYFYTEVDDVGAFLDDQGRYGRPSIGAE
jgi:hypothetical protein